MSVSHNEFGRSMVDDAAESSEIWNSVCLALQRRRRPELKFAPDALKHAARVWNREMMIFLLETQGPMLHLTCGVVEAVVANRSFGDEVMGVLQECGTVINITKSVAVAAFDNKRCGREILLQLLEDSRVSIRAGGLEGIAGRFDVEMINVLLGRSSIRVTEKALVAAAQNQEGLAILETLLMHRSEIHGVGDIAVGAAGNANAGLEILQFLINRGLKIPATENVREAGARHERHGEEIVRLLFDHHGKVIASERVIVAAAGNKGTGKLIIDFLLRHESELVLTEAMILAADNNKRYAAEIIDTLLEKSTNELHLTERIVKRFTKVQYTAIPWTKSARSDLSHVIFYILNSKHRDRVTFTTGVLVGILGCGTHDLTCDLVNILSERISITEDMIEAVAENNDNSHVAQTVRRLFEHTPSVRVTERAIVLAAQQGPQAKKLLETFFKHDTRLRVTQTQLKQPLAITEKAIAAAGNDVYDRITLDLFLSKCKGEIRLGLLDNATAAPTIDFIKQALKGTHQATITGPPMEEAVQLNHLELVACMLANGDPKTRTLSTKAAEGAVGNNLAGKEITQMLLAHNIHIDITASVVGSAAGNFREGDEIMDILLRDTERVGVSRSGADAICALMPPEIVRLLFDMREDVMITARMIEGAAKNSPQVLDVLVAVLGRLPTMTDRLIQAAASNANSLCWIHNNYGDDVEITQGAVEIAAGNSTAALQVMLENWGDQIHISPKAMEAVGTSYSIYDTVTMLFNMRPGETRLCEEFWIAFAESNSVLGAEERVGQLAGYCECIRITENLVAAIVKRRSSLLEMLLRSSRSRVTASGVEAIVRSSEPKIFALLLERHGHYLKITDRALEAAAENGQYGWEMVELLVRTRDESRSWCWDLAIEVAARNPECGSNIVELLLCEYPESRFATGKVLIAAAENPDKWMGCDIIGLLLGQQEDQAVVTTAVIDAAIANSLRESIISDLRDLMDNGEREMNEAVLA